MSKSRLRKELVTFSNEQLLEVILNVYDASKEAHDYLEFFLNPDAERLLEKKTDIIARELSRVRRGYSKARISVVRKAVRDFRSYGVGADYVFRMMLAAVRMLAGQNRYARYTDTLAKGTLTMTADFLAFADSAGMAGEALSRLGQLCADESFSTPAMRRAIERTVGDYASAIGKRT